MPRVSRAIRLNVSPDAGWDACMALLRSPDRRRGIIARRCEPEPPRREGSLVTVTVAPGGGTRELVSEIVEFDPPRRMATASRDAGPTVLVRLEVSPDGEGSRITLTSEATTGLAGGRSAVRLFDAFILGRSQRRSVRGALARLRELAAVEPAR